MNLLLHPNEDSQLSEHYKRAFKTAVELFIVNAYLTEWDDSSELNHNCQRFRIIVGKDFGITRKSACEAVMRWLTPERRAQFLMADQISGFHPKAVFWKEADGKFFALIGSSNLTKAAFKTNYEVNALLGLSESEYIKCKEWIRQIEDQSVIVNEDWLKKYQEATPAINSGPRKPNKKDRQ